LPLRLKTLLIVTVTMVGGVMLLYLAARFIVLGGFSDLEETGVEENYTGSRNTENMRPWSSNGRTTNERRRDVRKSKRPGGARWSCQRYSVVIRLLSALNRFLAD
jgi:hypothetical protein